MAFAQFRCRAVAQNRPPVVTDFQSRLRIVFRSSSQASTNGWQLYWPDRNTRWHLIHDVPATTNVTPLLEIIDDPGRPPFLGWLEPSPHDPLIPIRRRHPHQGQETLDDSHPSHHGQATHPTPEGNR
jgi:hypothetical protein